MKETQEGRMNHSLRERGKERERERERAREEGHRQTDRQTDRKTDRETSKKRAGDANLAHLAVLKVHI